MPTLNGWILDLYPSPGGMTLWILDAAAQAHCFTAALTASFFVHGTPGELHRVCAFIASARLPVTMRRTERHELFERREIELLEIAVGDPSRFGLFAQTVRRHFPDLAYYNADISLEQIYCFEHDLFPLARVSVEYDADRRLTAIANDDSPWLLDYALPPLKCMTVKLAEDESSSARANPNHHARPRPLEISVEDTTRVLIDDDPREMLLRFRRLLLQYDPDVILTAWGDSFILPRLLDLSQRYGVPLPLNRDPDRSILHRPARSYFSYGRIVYKTASHLLFGRWHIDCDNAFLIDDYSLDGIFELARVSRLPVQRVARVSTGTCVSAMEIATAYRDQILIPVVKSESEEMKSAATFVAADKGGLVFQPIMGLHEEVAELDFTSMFPTIMDRFNLSAETLNCSCCAPSRTERTRFPSLPSSHPCRERSPEHSLSAPFPSPSSSPRVPELAYWACQKHRGLIPKTIAPLVAKRSQYKQLARAAQDPADQEKYKRRVSCLKWALVTVFGYTGYRNARFGKIEAHEAINAYGRDALLQAKELAEARGFKMLHAIVDALYVQKRGARASEYAELVRAISDTTRLPIELEGVYHWLAFLPSRQDPRLPVANRYFGVMRDGETKVRGIETRRHDTPLFIKRAQTEMIQLLAQAKNRVEFRACMTGVLTLAADYLDALYAGQIPFAELAITQRLSREPRAYKTNHLNAIVARQFLEDGIELAPGERIQYIILDNQARVPSDRARPLEHIDGSLAYDAERYAELLLRSVTTLLSCVGISQAQLQAHFAMLRADPSLLRSASTPGTERPLFENASPRSGQRRVPPSSSRRALPAPRAELPLFEWARRQKQVGQISNLSAPRQDSAVQISNLSPLPPLNPGRTNL